MCTTGRFARSILIFTSAMLIGNMPSPSRAGGLPAFSTPPAGSSYLIAQNQYVPASPSPLIVLVAADTSAKLNATLGLAGKQPPNSMWCWVACLTGVFRYFGLDIDQAPIVTSLYGAPYNVAAPTSHVIDRLTMVALVGKDGKVFVLRADHLVVNGQIGWAAAIRYLAADVPLLIGVNPPLGGDTGHEMVLTAIQYAIWPNGTVQILDCIVRDPADPNPAAKKHLSVDEISRIASMDAVLPVLVQPVAPVAPAAPYQVSAQAIPDQLHPNL
jgi:hypothetical protein